jgi:hypothetical protein
MPVIVEGIINYQSFKVEKNESLKVHEKI